MRGISGAAVTAKAALAQHHEKRSLLFFLQAMSLRDDGLKGFCRQFVDAFPERIGTVTMFQVGIKPAKTYDLKTAGQILDEIDPGSNWRLWVDYAPQNFKGRNTGKDLLAECRAKLIAKLPGFIVELCINPKLYFSCPSETEETAFIEKVMAEERANNSAGDDSRENKPTYEKASLPWFKDIVPALFEYQARHNAAALSEFALTTIGEGVFEVLEVGFETSKMVVIEGNARIGKTTAIKAWCNAYLGEARFITLSGITHKTGLFRALGKALGIGSTYARSSTELQSRIEDLLHRSRLMIVIDESHHLFSSSERVYSRPELVDWINTALVNFGVPVALICTRDFALRMARAEKQTTWNSDQFKGRVKRFCKLPDRPTEKDLALVARKMLPEVCNNTIKLLVGYALTSPSRPFPALVDAIDEAKLIARKSNAPAITVNIVEKGIREFCMVSTKAMSRSFDEELNRRKGGRKMAQQIEAKPENLDPAVEPSLEISERGESVTATNHSRASFDNLIKA